MTTHKGNDQVVTPEQLREVLLTDGEECMCAPRDLDANCEWDAGPCPEHRDWCHSAGIGEYWHPACGLPHPDDDDDE